MTIIESDRPQGGGYPIRAVFARRTFVSAPFAAIKNGPRTPRAIFRAGGAALELRNLWRDPDTASVIAATLMIVAPVMFSVAVPVLVKIPVVRMIAEGYAGHTNPGMGVPAITFAIAHYIGRCGRTCETKARSCRQEGRQDDGFSSH